MRTTTYFMAFEPFNDTQIETLQAIDFVHKGYNYLSYNSLSLESSISFYKGTYNVDFYTLKTYGLNYYRTFDEAITFIKQLINF